MKTLVFFVICIFGQIHCTKYSRFVESVNKTSNDNFKCELPTEIKNEIKGYQEIVNKILDTIVNGKYSGDVHKSLMKMIDKKYIGRTKLENSTDYLVNELKTANLENVHTENATILNSTRDKEFAELVEPTKKQLSIIAIGKSVGTKSGGITAEVVVVESFMELKDISDDYVKGKIVVFASKWEGYEKTARYRLYGATEASKKGAVAVLIRSATPFKIGIMETGILEYEDNVPKIPAACISVEDVKMLLHMYRNGDRLKIHFEIDDTNSSFYTSRNTISELIGTTYKNKSVVVLSGHISDWLTINRLDNSGGAFVSWKALQYLKDMELRPKRTIRSILWTGNEFDMMGAQSYRDAHKQNEYEEFNFFLQSDTVRFTPEGLEFTGNTDAVCILKEIMSLFTSLNTTKFKTPMEGGADIDLWVSHGFPGGTLLNSNEHYFWKMGHFFALSMWRGPNEITVLEDPINLDKSTAFFAAIAYVIADLSFDIPKNILNNEISQNKN